MNHMSIEIKDIDLGYTKFGELVCDLNEIAERYNITITISSQKKTTDEEKNEDEVEA